MKLKDLYDSIPDCIAKEEIDICMKRIGTIFINEIDFLEKRMNNESSLESISKIVFNTLTDNCRFF